MTKIQKLKADRIIIDAFIKRKKIVVDGERIKGIMIGYIPEQEEGNMLVWWNIHDCKIEIGRKGKNGLIQKT
jgi:hypothetical protein